MHFAGSPESRSRRCGLLTSCAHSKPKATAIAADKAAAGGAGDSNATFSVTATGTAPLSYQWRFNGTNIPGATHAPAATNKQADALRRI